MGASHGHEGGQAGGGPVTSCPEEAAGQPQPSAGDAVPPSEGELHYGAGIDAAARADADADAGGSDVSALEEDASAQKESVCVEQVARKGLGSLDSNDQEKNMGIGDWESVSVDSSSGVDCRSGSTQGNLSAQVPASSKRFSYFESLQDYDVILIHLSSRSINILLSVILLLMLASFLFSLLLATSAVSLCEGDIAEFSGNPYLSILTDDLNSYLSNEAALSSTVTLFRSMLTSVASSKGSEILRAGQWGATPWCAWCTSESQDILHTKVFSQYFNDSIAVPVMSHVEWSDRLDAALADQNLSPYLCESSWYYQYQGAFNSVNYDASDARAVQSLFAVGINATLNTGAWPCTSANGMGLEKVLDQNGTRVEYLLDVSTNETVTLENVGVLYNRCISRLGKSFFELCLNGGGPTGYRSLYDDVKWNVPPPSGHTDLQTREYAPLLQMIKLFLQGNEELAEQIAETCGTFPSPLDFVEAPEESARNISSLSWRKGESALGVCWALQSLLYVSWPGCMHKALGVPTKEGKINVQPLYYKAKATADQILRVTAKPENLRNATSPPRPGETVAGGWSIPSTYLAYANGFGDALGWFPDTLEELVDTSTPCIKMMSESSVNMHSFFTFLGDMHSCGNAANLLLIGTWVTTICFFIALALGLTTSVLLLANRGSAYSPALIMFYVGSALICSDSPLWYRMHSKFHSSGDLSWALFTSLPPLPPLYERDTFFYAGGLACLYLYHVLFYTAVSASPDIHDPISTARNEKLFGIFVAFTYFIIRGPVLFWGLNANVGFIPFVNLITVGRVCSLSITTSFPYCASLDQPQEMRSFFGNLVASLADLIIIILVSRAGKRCNQRLRQLPFKDVRNRGLAFNLVKIISVMFFSSLLIFGVLYCSLVNVNLAYLGSVKFTQTGEVVTKEVSLKVTGVYLWNVVQITILVAAIGVNIFVLPTRSRIGRIGCPVLGSHDHGIKQFAFESVAIATLAVEKERMGKELRSTRAEDRSCLFLPHVFCLESHLNAYLATHSAYHVGTTYRYADEFLPSSYKHVAYLFHTKSDTHALVTRHKNRLYISFRGTTSAENVKTDARLALTRLRWRDLKEQHSVEAAHAMAEQKKSAASGRETSSSDFERGRSVSSASDSQSLSHAVSVASHCSSVNTVAAEPSEPIQVHQLSEKAARWHARAETRVKDDEFPDAAIHSGFLTAFSSVQFFLLETVAREEGINEIVCSGHSLGGGLAITCALYLSMAMAGECDFLISTFGCPRPGNYNFSRLCYKYCPSAWRFVRTGDPITKTPTSTPFFQIGYHHVGIPCLLEFGGLVVRPSLVELKLLHSCQSKLPYHATNHYGSALFAYALSLGDKVQVWENVAFKLHEFATTSLANNPNMPRETCKTLIAALSKTLSENKHSNTSEINSQLNVVTT